MKWSLKLGKLLGVDIHVHFTFLLLLVFLGFSSWRATHNAAVALAGPAVNVVIAAVLFVGLAATGSFTPVGELGLTSGSFWQRLITLNLILVVFNLLPAFPMDGARVLRALLAMRLGRRRATATAANVGQAMAIVFGLIGFFLNPFLIFIAIFVYLLTLEHISEMIMVHAAIDRQSSVHSWPAKLSGQNP